MEGKMPDSVARTQIGGPGGHSPRLVLLVLQVGVDEFSIFLR